MEGKGGLLKRGAEEFNPAFAMPAHKQSLRGYLEE